jgi:hypothetical protein
MAIFGNKDQLIAEMSGLKREVELLREFISSKEVEASDLRASIRILQDALIAKESPVAYRDMKSAEEAAATPQLDPETVKKNQQLNEANRLILRDLEGDLFRDADDMIDALSSVAGSPQFRSLHGNSES